MLSQHKQKLLPSMRANLRLRHFSPRTEEAYVGWVRRFVKFHRLEHPDRMGEAEVTAFLTHLAVERRVAPSTLTQALAALQSLSRHCQAAAWDRQRDPAPEGAGPAAGGVDTG